MRPMISHGTFTYSFQDINDHLERTAREIAEYLLSRRSLNPNWSQFS